MLHGIYLIDLGGRNMVSATLSEWFTETGIDTDELSGLLSALRMFAGDLTRGLGELTIIDIDIIYILPIVKKDVLIIGIADKNDERYMIYHFLEKLLDSFNDKYNKQGELSDWNGVKNDFLDFEKSIKEILKDPKFAEMSGLKPILKTFRKVDIKPEVRDKTLPKSVITQGILTQEEYDVAHLADGSISTEEIAKKHGIPLKKLQSALEKLDRLGLLNYIE